MQGCKQLLLYFRKLYIGTASCLAGHEPLSVHSFARNEQNNVTGLRGSYRLIDIGFIRLQVIALGVFHIIVIGSERSVYGCRGFCLSAPDIVHIVLAARQCAYYRDPCFFAVLESFV